MVGPQRHTKQRGQSLVEFALAFPLVVLILLGASDFARAMSAYIELGNMAREGAHYGSINVANSTDTTGIQTAALEEVGGSIFGVVPTISSQTGAETFTDPQGNPFQYVRVTVSYTFQPLVSFPPIRTISMQRTAQMRILPGN